MEQKRYCGGGSRSELLESESEPAWESSSSATSLSSTATKGEAWESSESEV